MVSTVNQTTLNRTVHLSNIIRAQYTSGRISLPQNGGLYSRFKHVQGVPSTTAGAGYSVSKLQMIDLLVERLVQLKGEAYPLETIDNNVDTDALVERYATALAEGLRNAGSISPSVTSGIAQSGLLIDLVA